MQATITEQGDKVRKMKAANAPKSELNPEIAKLVALKKEQDEEKKPTASCVFKQQLEAHINRLLGRTKCCHLVVFSQGLSLMQSSLTNPHLLSQIDDRYMVKPAPESYPHPWILQVIQKDLKMGVVESLDTCFYSMDNVLLFPHTHLTTQITKRLQNVNRSQVVDVFDLLEIFSDVSQILDDAKVHDILWFFVVASFSTLSQHIFTSEPLDHWPLMLRNAKAHTQVRIFKFVVSAMNITERSSPGMKPRVNWELSIEVDPLVRWLQDLLVDIRELVGGAQDIKRALPAAPTPSPTAAPTPSPTATMSTITTTPTGLAGSNNSQWRRSSTTATTTSSTFADTFTRNFLITSTSTTSSTGTSTTSSTAGTSTAGTSIAGTSSTTPTDSIFPTSATMTTVTDNTTPTDHLSIKHT